MSEEITKVFKVVWRDQPYPSAEFKFYSALATGFPFQLEYSKEFWTYRPLTYDNAYILAFANLQDAAKFMSDRAASYGNLSKAPYQLFIADAVALKDYILDSVCALVDCENLRRWHTHDTTYGHPSVVTARVPKGTICCEKLRLRKRVIFERRLNGCYNSEDFKYES